MMQKRYCKYCYETHERWQCTGEKTTDGKEIVLCEKCEHRSAA